MSPQVVEEKDVYDVLDVVTLLSTAKREYGSHWIDPYSKKPVEGCRNVYEDEESGEERYCIAGWVFRAVTPEEIEIPVHGSVASIKMNHPEIGDRFTEEAAVVLAFAQELQDMQTPWGAVCLAVDRHYLVEGKYTHE